MSTENVKILLRRGERDEITPATLEVSEMGFATDTNQLYIGIKKSVDEVAFDPFANAQQVIQSFLDSDDCEIDGLIINDDLVVREIPIWFDPETLEEISGVDKLLFDMQNTVNFDISQWARPRRNLEVITENSFSQLFADQHLSSLGHMSGLRPSLFTKSLKAADEELSVYNLLDDPRRTYTIVDVGDTDFTLIGYENIVELDNIIIGNNYKIIEIGDTDFTLIGAPDNEVGTIFEATAVGEVTDTSGKVSTLGDIGGTFTATSNGIGSGIVRENNNFLSYDRNIFSTIFVDYSLMQTDENIKFVRVGQLKVINGYPMGVTAAKLTDDNTEVWQDDSNGIAEVDEFSNIEFSTEIEGNSLKIKYTQDPGFYTNISYTVKRWSM